MRPRTFTTFEPRVLVARFGATCAECGGAIVAGQRIEWTPRASRAVRGGSRGTSRHYPGCATRTPEQRERDRDDAALAQYERDALGEW